MDFTAFAFLILAALPPEHQPQEQPRPLPLEGLVVVLDAGHGGIDPGSHGILEGNVVYESAYAADIAVRLSGMAETEGAVVVHTTEIPVPVSNSRGILLLDRKRSYPDGSAISTDRPGLQRRAATANRALEEYKESDVVFISLHLDHAAQNVRGTHIIAPPSAHPSEELPALVTALEQEFREHGLLRKKDGAEFLPVVRSADRTHGVKNVRVMRTDTNSVPQRAYLELSNLNNRADLKEVCDPSGRERIAQAILAGLVRFMKSSGTLVAATVPVSK